MQKKEFINNKSFNREVSNKNIKAFVMDMAYFSATILIHLFEQA